MGFSVDTNLYIDGESQDFRPKIVFIDTEREKEIGLGPDWPFEPMGESECIINKEIANNYDIKVGDEITPILHAMYLI